MKFELQTLENYTDEALLTELRRIAEVVNGQRLTIKKFNSLARVHSTTLRYRFGSWKAALDKAGISEEIAPRFNILTREKVIEALRNYAVENPGMPVTKEYIAEKLGVDKGSITRRFGRWKELLSEVGIAPVALGRRYTDEECFENILSLWIHYGRQPNFSELKHSPSTVGQKAYILRWGGWRAALSAFVKKINKPISSFNEAEHENDSNAFIEHRPETQKNTVIGTLVPRSIPIGMRYNILSRDKFRCVICGSSPAKDLSVELHVDHIHPWSRGGQNIEDNLRTLCSKCNLGKSDKIEDIET